MTQPDLFQEVQSKLLAAWRLLPEEQRVNLTTLADVACDIILTEIACDAEAKNYS